MADDTLPTPPAAPKLNLPEPFGPSTRVITKSQAPEARRLRLEKEAQDRLSKRTTSSSSADDDDRPTTRAGMLVRNLKSGRDLLKGGR